MFNNRWRLLGPFPTLDLYSDMHPIDKGGIECEVFRVYGACPNMQSSLFPNILSKQLKKHQKWLHGHIEAYLRDILLKFQANPFIKGVM